MRKFRIITYCILFFFWVTGNRPGRLLMGSIHGMIFLAFAAMVLGVRAEMGWTWKYTASVIILGPVGVGNASLYVVVLLLFLRAARAWYRSEWRSG